MVYGTIGGYLRIIWPDVSSSFYIRAVSKYDEALLLFRNILQNTCLWTPYAVFVHDHGLSANFQGALAKECSSQEAGSLLSVADCILATHNF